MRSNLVLALIFFLMVSGTSLLSSEAAPTRGEETGFFSSVQIFRSARSLSGGIGIGDVDDDGRNEVVICDFEGNVVMLKETAPGEFQSTKIWEDPRKGASVQGLLDLYVGNVLLDRPGVEILVGGYSRNLTVIYHTGSGFESRVIYVSPYQIFNIAVGEFDPASPGEEIFLASFEMGVTDASADRMLRMLRRVDGEFVSREFELPDTPKAVEVADIDPSVPGTEVWVTTSGRREIDGGPESGLYQVTLDGNVVERYKDPERLIANVKAGDLWSGNPGNELITVDFGGWCKVMWIKDGELEVQEIFRATSKTGDTALLEGLIVGDFNPRLPGVEALTTGYYNDVTQITEVGGEMVDDLIWATDVEDPFLELAGLAIGDFSEIRPGSEIALASRQGWVQLIYFELDGIDLDADEEVVEMPDGSSKEFYVTVVPRGYIRGSVSFSVEGGEGLEFTFPPNVMITSHDPFQVPVEVEADFGDGQARSVPFRLLAASGAYSAEMDMMVDLKLPGSISLGSSYIVMYPELGITREVEVTLTGLDEVQIGVETPEGLTALSSEVLKRGVPDKLILVAEKDAPPGTYPVTVSGAVSGEVLAQSVLLVKVTGLSEDVSVKIEMVSQDRYRVTSDYKGGRLDVPVDVAVFVGKNMQDTRSVLLDPLVPVVFEFDYRGKTDQMAKVTFSGPSGEVGYSVEPGVVYATGGERGIPVGILILVIVVIIIVAVLIFYGLSRMKPASGEDESLIGIGRPTRYGSGRTEPERRGSARDRYAGRSGEDSSRRGRGRDPPGDRGPKRLK